MAEAPVAFPNDETTAEVIASRLRTEGIAARVDRGLYGDWQVPAPSSFERLAVVLLFVALGVGIAAILVLAVTR